MTSIRQLPMTHWQGCRLTLRFRGHFALTTRSRSRSTGRRLPRQSGSDAVDGWTRMGITAHFWMEYPAYPEERQNEGKSLTFEVACPPLRQGDNAIGVSLVPSGGNAGSAATLTNVELDVAYKR